MYMLYFFNPAFQFEGQYGDYVGTGRGLFFNYK